MGFIIICDEHAGKDTATAYFVRLGLGLFWECSLNESDARVFKTRLAAAKVLHDNGKHNYGWRIVKGARS